MDYKIAKKILKYKEDHGLSYKSLGKLLECDGASLHYLLTKSKVSLAFHVVDKFETLDKKAKPAIEIEKDDWE